jgi:hypothetical protein
MQRKTAQITPWVHIWAPKCRATARNQGRPFGSLRKSLRSASGSGFIWGIPVNAGLADPQLNARIKGLGADPMPMTPTEFGTFMADETEKWAKVVKFSGAKAGP